MSKHKKNIAALKALSAAQAEQEEPEQVRRKTLIQKRIKHDNGFERVIFTDSKELLNKIEGV